MSLEVWLQGFTNIRFVKKMKCGKVFTAVSKGAAVFLSMAEQRAPSWQWGETLQVHQQ